MIVKRFRGDTKRMKHVVRDGNRKAIDVAAWSFVLTINREENPEDTLQQVVAIPAVIDDGLNGKIFFPFTGVSVDVGEYFFDIEATDGNGETDTLVKGCIVFEQDITKSD